MSDSTVHRQPSTVNHTSLYDQIQEAINYLRTQTDWQPEIGIILGTGLGALADEIERVATIPYAQIPHFAQSTVQSHKGELIFGTLAGRKVVAMAGRFHYYEGYSMRQVTFPVRVMKFLGIEQIIISNVAGSTNQHIFPGDIVFVKDHINLQPENPLRGENDERLGVRFPDMMKVYDLEMNQRALKIGIEKGIRCHEGVYVGLQGPNLETPAEYNYLHIIGGDLVGMSTIPEVIVAQHSGLKIFVLSIVSNQCYPKEIIKETTLEEVVALANRTAPKMCFLVKELLKN
ncbi:MAG: purine-nucleoside phosphorylase [Saprospiraceae bacterium]